MLRGKDALIHVNRFPRISYWPHLANPTRMQFFLISSVDLLRPSCSAGGNSGYGVVITPLAPTIRGITEGHV